MKHIIILYYILSFAVGFLAFSTACYLYTRYKNKLIKYYIYFLLAFTFNFILNSYNFYQHSIIANTNPTYSLIYLYLRIIGRGLILYIVPLFHYNLIGVGFSGKKRMIFSFLLVSAFCFILVSYSFTGELEEKIIWAYKGYLVFSCFLLLMILHFNFSWIKRLSKIQQYEVKLVIKTLLITTMISFPIIFIEHLFPVFRFTYNGRVISFSGMALFYFILNTTSLLVTAWYFNTTREKSNPLPIDLFSDKYGITNREKEVILKLIQGKSNKEICESLFISMPTVKTHVRNIYQKAKVKNRVELVNRIKQS